jgi:exopolysaccharide biosynthesis polyprenyl glycosylphosphotransferase
MEGPVGVSWSTRDKRLIDVGRPTVASEPLLGLGGSGGEAAFVEVSTNEVVDFQPLSKPSTALGGLLGASLWQLAIKRAMDIVGSLLLLVLVAPLLVIFACAIAFTSPGPVLFRQERVGRDGRPFTMFKFRSMYDRAHEERENHHHMNEATGPVFKIREDPRTTSVGRLIRRTSIDELPQLVNVLLGEMSLVGPRPPLPEECEQYGEREMGRLLVKPGITCNWQVSGRSDLDFDTWVTLDLDYINTWTLRQDVALLLKTVPAVFTGKGAY